MTAPVLAVPGMYPRTKINEREYRAINAVNQSTLKAMERSPLHYRHRLDHPEDVTEPMRLGSLAHCACLEPNEVQRRFVVWAPVDEDGEPVKDDRRGNKYKVFAAQAAIDGREVIKQRDLDAAWEIREALVHNKLAARYLKRGESETVLLWRDEETGLPCKARIDWISHSVADVLLELKTAADVSPRAFQQAFAKNGYDVQAAFYADGYKACTGRDPGGKVIAIENAGPFDSVVYDLNEVIDTGREIYRDYMRKLAECRAANRWPGQAEDAEQILRLPRWRDPFEEDEAAEPMFEGLEV